MKALLGFGAAFGALIVVAVGDYRTKACHEEERFAPFAGKLGLYEVCKGGWTGAEQSEQWVRWL